MPRRLTDHTLDGLKGWFNMHAVDKVAKFNATDLATLTAAGHTAYAGRTVHLHSDGTFKYGVTDRSMPMWLFPNADDPDVSNDGGDPATEVGAWVAIAPTKEMVAIVGCGALELSTTEFDATLTYAYNDTLTAPTGTTNASSGKLTNADAVPYTNPVCGVVSLGRGPTDSTGDYQNSHGVKVLNFWPWYIPVA